MNSGGGAELLADGCENLVFRREARVVFLCHLLIAHPDRELAALAFDEVGVEPRGLLDQRRRTGGAG